MGLHFPGEWRFNPPADGTYFYTSIPDAAVREFADVVDRISSQGNRWEILEHFKSHFGASGSSSSESWAESDLDRAMRFEARTAPLFIEAFFNGCDSLRNRPEGWYAPEPPLLNAILARHNVGYEIKPPNLVVRDLTSASIPVVAASPELGRSGQCVDRGFIDSLGRTAARRSRAGSGAGGTVVTRDRVHGVPRHRDGLREG